MKRLIILFVLSCNYNQDVVDADYILKNKDNPNIILIDVRSNQEFEKGHIPGTKYNIPMDRLREEFVRGNIKINKEDTIVVYCQKGILSSKAYEILKALGYNVKHYKGSLQDWKDKNLPIDIY
ncbi:MAG: rhodanese-like domain-containing protein [candidate division WOR-3 bacterium]|nr:rhodanese-like domain-containing protein [candidate division WOR-3 bacterium]MCX7947307.1 rhodanese-like domain-containing protein [candidate division WOR-3 bacterium]MDW8150136.1 rhodanese-like domain-containing protein [candidate division WOR-3 bacterium]